MSEYGSCQKVSAGFSIAPPMGPMMDYRIDPQVKAMCASDTCHALIKDVLDLKPADCFLSLAGVKLNVYKMVHNFEDGCKRVHEEDKHHPTTNETEYHPTPDPTKYEDHLTPTKVEYHPTPQPTEDDKHYPTPKPTKHHVSTITRSRRTTKAFQTGRLDDF
ncbi:hypothetical protein V7S43_000413 [Phytophthora oleae]|uniref:Elicitin n=1 Tax=Phytophthora oleae TaxID=2107226 RepID=A0ABD3G8W1_9STRA